MAQTDSWAIVATVDEPLELLVAFTCHHLHLGASEVWLYLDRPDPAALAELAAIPGCRPVTCDDAYWRSLGRRRPAGINRRQVVNAAHAYENTGAAWLGHLDSDEFLMPEPGFLHELANVPLEFAGLHIANVERAWLGQVGTSSIFEGLFRVAAPLDPALAQRLFGPALDFTDHGFSAHVFGKSFARTGLPIRMGIHAPRPQQDATADRLFIAESQQAVICHYDGLTRQHWIDKIKRYHATGMYPVFRRGDGHRHNQIRHVASNSDDALAVHQLHDLLKLVTEAQYQDLSDHACLRAIAIDPPAAVAGLLGRRDLDFTPAYFDRQLARRQATPPP